MNLQKSHLQQAVDKRIISEAQAAELWALWQRQSDDRPRFAFTHVLYYLGGLLAIGAISLFMTLGWEQFGGGAIVLLCAVYAAVAFVPLGHFRRKNLHIPAAIVAVFIVALVPLAVYGLQDLLGYWSDGDSAYRDYHRWIDWRWLFMELATLAAAAAMLWRYRYPFIVLPIAFTLWYLSMDVCEWIRQARNGADYGGWSELRSHVSIAFGIGTTALAVWTDYRRQSPRDYAFWLYIFGVLTFWGGLTGLDSDNELGKFVYCCINLAMIFVGVLLQRRVFTVFGAIGVFMYLGHLSYKVFKYSWLFPVALTLIGLAVVLLGVWWQKHETRLRERLNALLPENLRRFLARQ